MTTETQSPPAPLTNPAPLSQLKGPQNQYYNAVKKALSQLMVTLPPSSAMAGIYTQVDTNQGVWTAPANVVVSSVIAPTVKITRKEQGGMNVSPSTGKSINAIRSFPGKGTLVWGARTLDGNSNEWRYVSVRRLFIMVEQSVKDAISWAVFAPNDANTWVRVKAQISGFLTGLWKAGALTGSKASDAFFVNVGLGTTMTAQDIENGDMILQIGLAPVRPAEFIILEFSQKVQES